MTKDQKEELKTWHDQARSGVRRKMDCMKEAFDEMTAYDRVLEAMDELISDHDDLSDKLENQQSEIDELNEQLEQKDTQGCILVGRNQIVGQVLESRKWLYELKMKIVEAKNRGESVWLTIK